MPQETQPDSSESSFPILAISVIGIIATAIILFSYYVFVTKCCLNWQHFRIIFDISRSGRRHRRDGGGGGDLFAFYSAIMDAHGLEEGAIQSIPNFRYQRGRVQCSFHECSVCLNEFQEEERIRMLPNCFHVFHIDCIDTWLQTHKNCPICRSEITTTSPLLTNEITERNFNQNYSDERESLVAEVREDEARRTERRFEGRTVRKMTQVSSMGDECIGMRGEGREFGVQPMRRSFSLDSSNDRLLCIAVQEILQNNKNLQALSNGEGSSNGNSGKVRRSFFSFSHSKSSKSAVLPIQS
ncbi:RING-H2 finger protein ATL16-like [Dendrobium catenatum]|uniref:RING-type E3 ubiquitin transferase n=1 Tax=Dendrobium catenatum TaxID=906689 RepID=A0A2I0VTG9_9ASPA|nr:RING-H2 finger protein ATL16-like [Dendrobium catenatum]PKU66706.1 RING-H2 finger protein ATL16 [Dendrobium catenatum]